MQYSFENNNDNFQEEKSRHFKQQTQIGIDRNEVGYQDGNRESNFISFGTQIQEKQLKVKDDKQGELHYEKILENIQLQNKSIKIEWEGDTDEQNSREKVYESVSQLEEVGRKLLNTQQDLKRSKQQVQDLKQEYQLYKEHISNSIREKINTIERLNQQIIDIKQDNQITYQQTQAKFKHELESQRTEMAELLENQKKRYDKKVDIIQNYTQHMLLMKYGINTKMALDVESSQQKQGNDHEGNEDNLLGQDFDVFQLDAIQLRDVYFMLKNKIEKLTKRHQYEKQDLINQIMSQNSKILEQETSKQQVDDEISQMYYQQFKALEKDFDNKIIEIMNTTKKEKEQYEQSVQQKLLDYETEIKNTKHALHERELLVRDKESRIAELEQNIVNLVFAKQKLQAEIQRLNKSIEQHQQKLNQKVQSERLLEQKLAVLFEENNLLGKTQEEKVKLLSDQIEFLNELNRMNLKIIELKELLRESQNLNVKSEEQRKLLVNHLIQQKSDYRQLEKTYQNYVEVHKIFGIVPQNCKSHKLKSTLDVSSDSRVQGNSKFNEIESNKIKTQRKDGSISGERSPPIKILSYNNQQTLRVNNSHIIIEDCKNRSKSHHTITEQQSALLPKSSEFDLGSFDRVNSEVDISKDLQQKTKCPQILSSQEKQTINSTRYHERQRTLKIKLLKQNIYLKK